MEEIKQIKKQKLMKKKIKKGSAKFKSWVFGKKKNVSLESIQKY